ncbi:hypothetical protein ABVG11_15205 [Streptomyces sp. HD1123-B1]|uniref:hypothetical protein n=1 Tax=Streptomyces huangiella TaxID=3228804 RepID=UPI003D7E7BDC
MSRTLNTTYKEDRVELEELGKFFALFGERQARGDNRPMPMFSERIDDAWHRLTADSEGLASFCARHAGIPVGHVPVQGSGNVDWVQEYTTRFGALPHVWFTDASGQIDTVALHRYEREGIVVTGWDCTPVPSGGDDEVARSPLTTTACQR